MLEAIVDRLHDLSSATEEHPTMPAGYTYFGQFLTHDVTFDPATVGQRATDPDLLHSYRSPSFDLDSVYGRGPNAQEWLYQRDRKRLAVYPSDQGLPRNKTGKALIPDGRNDENVVLSHLHYALALLHNMQARDMTFEAARRSVQWHYQWVILHDYLQKILLPSVYDRLAETVAQTRPKVSHLLYYQPKTGPYVPIEFAAAAFRFGHSMIREEYELNPALSRDLDGEKIPVFMLGKETSKLANVPGTFSVAETGQPDGWFVYWPFFLNTGNKEFQHAMRIDTHLNRRLFGTIRDIADGRPDRRVSLAWRDLRIGVQYGLPSGQTLARALGLPREDILDSDQIGLGHVDRALGISGSPSSLNHETPLWLYILREAQETTGGLTLGRLGSEIVGETILGLLLEDKFSFLTLDPRWKPDLGSNGHCELKDLITAAL